MTAAVRIVLDQRAIRRVGIRQNRSQSLGRAPENSEGFSTRYDSEASTCRHLLRFILLTATGRNEAAKMKRQEIGGDVWTLNPRSSACYPCASASICSPIGLPRLLASMHRLELVRGVNGEHLGHLGARLVAMLEPHQPVGMVGPQLLVPLEGKVRRLALEHHEVRGNGSDNSCSALAPLLYLRSQTLCSPTCCACSTERRIAPEQRSPASGHRSPNRRSRLVRDPDHRDGLGARQGVAPCET
jgi:hypothetical protein